MADSRIGPPLSGVIREVIRGRILRGELVPGARLHDFAIADELETSRSPVREALRLLEAEGLVEDVPRRGKFVRRFTVEDVLELYEVEVVIETAAVERARARGSFDRARLDALVEAMAAASASDDVFGLVEAELALHDAIVEMSGNRELLRAFRAIRGRLQLALVADMHSEQERASLEQDHAGYVSRLMGQEPADAIVSAHVFADSTGLVQRLREVLPD